jgi:hypothetical protein
MTEWGDIDDIRAELEGGALLMTHSGVSRDWDLEDIFAHLQGFVGGSEPLKSLGFICDECNMHHFVFGIAARDRKKFSMARLDTRMRGELAWAQETFPELTV